jgi:dihydroflavonol-4-reductase
MAYSVLVSGANGFIASHIIARLLADGHSVTGTVRNPHDKDRNAHLVAPPGTAGRLRLVAADLNAEDPFAAHVDVDAILHMASPYVLNVTDPQRDLVDPAVAGTMAMLRAAAASPRVKRVVLTSSMAAITDEPDGRVLTEADWNEKSSLTRNPYYYSKTLAERAAWDFMAQEKPGFELVVINPFMVIGPELSNEVNTSNQMFVDMANGTYPAIMALEWGFVDVRDVAEAHVRAMTEPGAQGRYLCGGNADHGRCDRAAATGGRLAEKAADDEARRRDRIGADEVGVAFPAFRRGQLPAHPSRPHPTLRQWQDQTRPGSEFPQHR